MLRKKYKNDRKAYKDAKTQLRWQTGEKYYESLEIAIRHHTAPIPARRYSNGCGCSGTTISPSPKRTCSVAGILALHPRSHSPEHVWQFHRSGKGGHDLMDDDCPSRQQRIGRPEPAGQMEARKRRGCDGQREPCTRVAGASHRVASGGIYAEGRRRAVLCHGGLGNRWSKKREECNPVHFEPKSHEPGNHVVMGKRYKQRGLSAKSKLTDVIEDLCAHPSCAEFVSTKLVRHFVTDDVTPEMVQPSLMPGQRVTAICRRSTRR